MLNGVNSQVMVDPAHIGEIAGSVAQPSDANVKYRVGAHRGERITLDPHPDSPDSKGREDIRTWLTRQPRPWAVDLFCGAGGLSFGLQEAGFSVVAAADSDQVSTETHAANMRSLTWTGDLSRPSGFIDQLDEWGIESVDLVAGGPPCQPFSNAGVSKIGDLVRRGQRKARDKRADLWQSFFAIIDRLKPNAMLFENVPNFAQAQGGALLIALIDELKYRGYGVHVELLDAWRYRVPQHRSRLFVVGIASNGRFEWPEPRGRRPTVGQAIGDLPVVQADSREEILPYEGRPTTLLGRMLRRGLKGKEARQIRDHVTRAVRPDDAEIYGLMRPGDTYLNVPERLRRYRSDIFNDKYLRLSFDDLSRTITAHIAKDGYWYIHPREDRTLSIREAARIQTFPDGFRFAGRRTSRYQQIGNAVPPMLASAIATSLLSALGHSEERLDADGLDRPDENRFRIDLTNWFRENRREFPWRRSGVSPWQVLLIEMCLHRTRAEQVAQVADDVLDLGRTPEKFLENLEDLAPLLASLGLRWRIDNIEDAATFIRENMGGRVPDNWQELIAIPGVGDYIASAVLCFAFGRPTVLMDTNTIRIARRIMGGSTQQNWRLRLSLHSLAGTHAADAEWNQALLDLGARVCTARKPRCEECPVRAHCATGRDRSGQESATASEGSARVSGAP